MLLVKSRLDWLWLVQCLSSDRLILPWSSPRCVVPLVFSFFLSLSFFELPVCTLCFFSLRVCSATFAKETSYRSSPSCSCSRRPTFSSLCSRFGKLWKSTIRWTPKTKCLATDRGQRALEMCWISTARLSWCLWRVLSFAGACLVGCPFLLVLILLVSFVWHAHMRAVLCVL